MGIFAWRLLFIHFLRNIANPPIVPELFASENPMRAFQEHDVSSLRNVAGYWNANSKVRPGED